METYRIVSLIFIVISFIFLFKFYAFTKEQNETNKRIISILKMISDDMETVRKELIRQQFFKNKRG